MLDISCRCISYILDVKVISLILYKLNNTEHIGILALIRYIMNIVHPMNNTFIKVL